MPGVLRWGGRRGGKGIVGPRRRQSAAATRREGGAKRYLYTPFMRAIKLQTQVERDHILRIELPEDVAEGPAEVIVLVQEPKERSGHSLEDFLTRLSQRPRTIRTKEEIDQYLQEERASWEP